MMDIITLRQWEEGYERVAALIHQEWSSFERWASAETVIQRLRQRNTAGNDEVTVVALEAGTVIATASIIKYELDDNAERKYWLGEVLTAESHRGQGIAGLLIRTLIETARAAGYPALWLYTPDQQAFYARRGWESVEEKYINEEWSTVMVLHLLATDKEKA